jgi:putative phosphoribosyl transferase
MLHVKEFVDRPYPAFENRHDAGLALAEFLLEKDASVDAIVAVPSGGVAVARSLSDRLGVPFDIILVRKLPLPMEPEAGFGAVTLNGEVELNDALVGAWGLSERDIQGVVKSVLKELRQRKATFLAGRQRLDPAGRDVLLVDDGLASGYTVKVAIRELQRREPHSVGVAVPDAPLSTAKSIEPLVDDLYCLVAQRQGSFAVASFYRQWHDLTDDEVMGLLRGGRCRKEPGAA